MVRYEPSFTFILKESYNRRNQVQIDLEEYEAKNAQIGALSEELRELKEKKGPNKESWMWLAPEYFSRFRMI